MNDIKLRTIIVDDKCLNNYVDPKTYKRYISPIRFGLYGDKFAAFLAELGNLFEKRLEGYKSSNTAYHGMFNDPGRTEKPFRLLFNFNYFYAVIDGGYKTNNQFRDSYIFRNQFNEICMLKVSNIGRAPFSIHNDNEVKRYIGRQLLKLIKDKPEDQVFYGTTFTNKDVILVAKLLINNRTTHKYIDDNYDKEYVDQFVGKPSQPVDPAAAEKVTAYVTQLNESAAKEVDALNKAAEEAISLIVKQLKADHSKIIEQYKHKYAEAVKDAGFINIGFNPPAITKYAQEFL